jgi:hypothetical protein
MSAVSELEKNAEHISRKSSSVKRMPNGMSDKDGSLYCCRRVMTAVFAGAVNRGTSHACPIYLSFLFCRFPGWVKIGDEFSLIVRKNDE